VDWAVEVMREGRVEREDSVVIPQHSISYVICVCVCFEVELKKMEMSVRNMERKIGIELHLKRA